MERPRYRLYEMALAVAFLGLYFALIAGSWSSLPAHGIVGGGMILFPAYLLAVVMIRQHREGQ